MNVDFYFKENEELSTYFSERGEMCKSNIKIAFQYRKIEHDIKELTGINELKKRYELTVLDNNTKLTELKYDQIRVIYFVYINETFVYLGTFLKKSGKTPPSRIENNNNRIKSYKETHGHNDEWQEFRTRAIILWNLKW